MPASKCPDPESRAGPTTVARAYTRTVADNKKLLAVINVEKPVSEMTEQEKRALARHVVGQVQHQVPRPSSEKP